MSMALAPGPGHQPEDAAVFKAAGHKDWKLPEVVKSGSLRKPKARATTAANPLHRHDPHPRVALETLSTRASPLCPGLR